MSRFTRSFRVGASAVALAVSLALLPALPSGATRDPAASPATFETRGSVHQVFVLGAPAQAPAELRRRGRLLQRGTVDENGGLLFRNVKAGTGYTVTVGTGGAEERSDPVRVLSADESPPHSLYRSQTLAADNLSPTNGFGYLTTRDGTTLSVQVALPGPADQGPYPTVVEYSGYDPSSPTTGQPQYKLLMPLLGFAWVGVNIRGTGCSGGAFNYFENLQALDGYDAIETIAEQPWSTGRVGMVGISYAGISQLFAARTQPPHLKAITPVSVIDDTYRGTLYPGGIFNDGFALSWAKERMEQNKWPNPDAPTWVRNRIADGDTECAANMGLRGQNVDLIRQIEERPYFAYRDPQFRYDFPEGGSSLAPADFVDQIRAKVFIAGAWQDEQTGGHWANMLERFSPRTRLRVVGQNGVHVESLDPSVLAETLEFLQIYVAREVPSIPAGVRALAPTIWETITGVGGLTFPPDRFADAPDAKTARREFEAEPPVRILWETGNASGLAPGTPVAAAETRYAAWPIAVRATTWYLGPRGTLARDRPEPGGEPDSYRPDPALRPRTNLPSGNVWRADPPYQWAQVVDGASLAYLSEPLEQDTAMAGTGSVDLWIASSAPDNDVQVTLSEVRPDGTERYVQNGWLRLSHRKLDASRSTPLNPFHSDTERDAEPMPQGRFVRARVAIFPFAHEFRAGSRIRLTIQAPGGDRPAWTFGTPATGGTVTNRVAHDVARPSRVVLPVLRRGPVLPEAAAPCPSLRGQPCRPYVEPEIP